MEQTYDLTQGNIKRQLIYLSIPLLIGSIFQQFYNTIDSIIVGTYVGHDAFAAIGISGTVMNLFIFIIIGCCTGVSIITAQLYGEKKEQDVNEVADQLMRINEQLAIKNRRSHRVWKTVGIVLLIFVLFNVGLVVLNYAAFESYENNSSVQVENVDE